MKVIRHFLSIVGAALGSAVLGGLFGALVAVVSPELAQTLFGGKLVSRIRYSAAVGMLWGFFIGAGVMGFCVLVGAVTTWLRRRNGPDDTGAESP